MTKKQDEFLIDDSYDMDGEDEDDLYLHETEDDEDEFKYNMDGDDIDDEDDEDDENYHEDGFIENDQALDSLDVLVVKLSNLVEERNFDTTQLRQVVFEEALGSLAKERGVDLYDLIICSSTEDVGYNQMISGLYPAIAKHLSQVINEKNRPLLIELLHQAILSVSAINNETGVPNSTKFIDSSTLDDDDIKAEIDEYEIDMAVVAAVVNDVMKVYDRLYKPMFINKPKGILTAEGILTPDKNGQLYLLKSDLNTLNLLYGAFVNYSKGYLQHKPTVRAQLDASYFNQDGGLNFTYCPSYHALNIFGFYKENGQIKQEVNWLKFKIKLKKMVKNKVMASLKQVGNGFDIDTIEASMKELLTNCVIIQDFDRTKVLAMTFRLGVERLGVDMSKFSNILVANQKTLLKSEIGEMINGSFDNFNIGSILYAYDSDTYNKEILFSYKLFDKMAKSGVKPSPDNLIIGRKLNGEDYGINFSAQNNIVTSIIAGSGSGKGVVTLNTLATLIASGSPVVYMDFKPDMAAMLWELERELGVPIYSVDAKENKHKFGALPVRNPGYGYNAPSGFEGYINESHWAVIPYLKTIQLLCVAASMRSSDQTLMKDGKLYAILDELQTFNTQFGTTVSQFEVFEKKFKKDESKADALQYVDRFRNIFITDLQSAIMDLLRTSGRNGLTGLILLGQSVNPNDWRFGDKPWSGSPLVKLLTDSNYRLAGAKHKSTNSSYTLDKLRYDGSSFIDKSVMGYFAVHSGYTPPSDGNAVTVVKSYLTLNANDVEKALSEGSLENPSKNSFVGGLLGNINDIDLRERIVREDMYNPDGEINTRVGFPGLIKSIINYMNGGNMTEDQLNQALRKNLGKSYSYMYDIMKLAGLGHYSSVEEYLYDCSPESLFYYGDLKKGIRNVEDSLGEMSDWMNDGNTVDHMPTATVSEVVVSPSSELNKDWLNPENDNFDHMPNEEFSSPHYKTGLNISEDTDNSQEQWGTQRQQDIPFTQKDMEQVQQAYNQGQQSKPKPTYESPNQQLHYDNLYNEQIQLEHNPFIRGSRSEGVISALNSIRMMSNYIMQDILRVFGDYSRIESIEITGTGLVLNNIAYRPQFAPEVIESMPYDIKVQVVKGNILELFHFENLNRFKNIGVLRIDNPRLAEGRVRREIELHPRKNWNVLFKKFPYLREINIAGAVITDQDSAQAYNEKGRKGYELQEKLREKLKIPTSRISSSVMEKVWHSAPVKITSGALGFTLGVKAVGVAAALFGGWGLLFGAFMGYGAYRELKRRR